MVPRFFGSQLPVVVGCGVRLGHKLAAASLRAESARAMPMPNSESEPRTKLSLSALHIECHNYCPALGMYARMWSATWALSGDPPNTERGKDMKQQTR